MIDGHDEGTTSLTLSTAASRIEGLISKLEDNQDRETPPEDVEERQAPDDSNPEDEQVDETELSEEPEESEDEEPSEDEPEDPETEDTPEPDPQPKTRKIKVNGEEVEVTEEELEKGYSRTADYTRKTQQLAEEKAAVAAERTRYVETLTKLESTLEKLAGKEPDWDQLRQEMEPDEFAATYTDWQIHKDRLAKLAAERQKVEQEAAVENQKAYEKYLEQEHQKTLAKIPEWKDAKVAKQEVEEIRQFANSLGFSDEELAGVTDHRLMALLRKGMLQERAAKSKPAVQRQIEKVRVVKPGSAKSNRPPVTEVTRAKQRLAKTGSVADAAAALELLDD